MSRANDDGNNPLSSPEFVDFITTVLSCAGPLFFICLQLSSIRTALTICEKRSTLSYSQFPFIALFTNCFVWVLYGLQRNNIPVLVPNGTGFCAGLFCMSVYQTHSTSPRPVLFYSLSAGIIVLVFGLALIQQTETIGLIGDFLAGK